MPLPDKDKPWRIDVDLREGDDFKLHFATKEAALAAIEQICNVGYVTQDRILDQTKYEIAVYPLSNVRSFSLYEKG